MGKDRCNIGRFDEKITAWEIPNSQGEKLNGILQDRNNFTKNLRKLDEA